MNRKVANKIIAAAKAETRFLKFVQLTTVPGAPDHVKVNAFHKAYALKKKMQEA